MPEQRTKGISWTFGPTVQSSDPMRDTFQQLEKAEGLRQQGQIDQARLICEALVRQHSDYFGALYTLGLIHADNGQYRQAFGFLIQRSCSILKAGEHLQR